MDIALLAARLILAAVFLVAGVGKLADQDGSRKAVRDFGIPTVLATPVGLLLPLCELAVAILLVLTQTAWIGALGAGVLLVLFIVAISASLARGQKPDCRCFGQVASGPVGWQTVARNVALLAIAGFVAVQGRTNSGTSAVSWLADLTTSERVGLLIALAGFSLLLGQWGFLMSLLQQNGRLLTRLETLETSLDTALRDGIPTGNTAMAQPAPVMPVAGLPVGTPAPPFSLQGLFGETMTLDALRARETPLLLVFTDPGCGPCGQLLPDIGRWQRELTGRLNVALLSRGAPEANRAKMAEHGVTQVLLQQDFEVADAYQAGGTPSAVIVLPDGSIGSPLSAGVEQIRSLAAQFSGASSSLPIPLQDRAPERPASLNGGSAAPPAGLALGAPVPSMVLKDLDNKKLDLADLRDSKTLLLFWNLGCGFCQSMLPDLKEWERSRGADSPDLVVISGGSVEDNRAMGLHSRILLDATGQVASTFGAQGTPMGVLIDDQGRVASEVGAGAPGVFALVGSDLGQSPANGNGAGPAGVKVGDPLPDIKLQDLNGGTISLTDLRGQDYLLLFWNHGCGFCQQMLPDLREWEQSKPSGAPRLVVIANGTIEDNRALGLSGTILLDDAFRAGPAFGANGTPMGVLVDADGRVASEVGAGAPGVFALAAGNPDGSQSGRR